MTDLKATGITADTFYQLIAIHPDTFDESIHALPLASAHIRAADMVTFEWYGNIPLVRSANPAVDKIDGFALAESHAGLPVKIVVRGHIGLDEPDQIKDIGLIWVVIQDLPAVKVTVGKVVATE